LVARDDPVAVLSETGVRARGTLVAAAAEMLVNEFGGDVPDSEAELRRLAGVGDYMAQAVLCFAFGRRAVLLDAVTERVIGRFCGREDRRRWQVRLDLYRLAGALGPDAAFNHALLDLGATVCLADAPDCPSCPLRPGCAAAVDLTSEERLIDAA
jgi:A/G-specific adenine glycosylase